MRKIYFFALLVIGILAISGCSTRTYKDNQELKSDFQKTVKSAEALQKENNLGSGKSEASTDINNDLPNIKNLHEAVLDIQDMTCTSCALGIEYQLKQLSGVVDAKISYEEGKGYVKYDADKISAEEIAKASDVYPASVVSDKIIS